MPIITLSGQIALDAISATVVTITAADSPYTVKAKDHSIRGDCTNGPIVVLLPSATGTGRELRFKKIDSTDNSFTAKGDSVDDSPAGVALIHKSQSITLSDGAVGAWDLY